MNLRFKPVGRLTLLLLLNTVNLLGDQTPLPAQAGFFRAEQRHGRWWLVDPSGQPFLSKGVCHIAFAGDAIRDTRRSPYREAVEAKYGNAEKWREAAANRLMDWGFNSLGAWSDEKLSAVVVNGRQPEEAAVARAEEEHIPIIVTELPAFDVIGILYRQGIRGRRSA